MPSIAAILPTVLLPGSKPSTGNSLWPPLLSCFFALLLLLTCGNAYGAQNLQLGSNSTELHHLARYSDLLDDPDRRFNIQDVHHGELALRFRPTEAGDLSIGGGEFSRWFRFTVVNANDTSLHRVLQVQPAGLDKVILHREVTPLPAISLPEQYLTRNQQLFAIDAPPHSATTYYLRIDNDQGQQLSLQLMDYGSLIAKSNQQEMSNAVFFGILLALLLFTAGRSLVFRDALFAVVASYALLIMLLQAFAWGYIGPAQSLLPPWSGQSMMVVTLLILCSETLYAGWFPVFRRDKPAHWPVVIRGLMIVILLALTIGLIKSDGLSAAAVNSLVVVNTLILCITAFYCYLHTYSRLILYYLLARLALLLLYSSILVGYYTELLSLETLNFLLVLMTTTSALVHTSLLLARRRKRQQKRAQEALRIAVLGEVSRGKTDIVARITHDIRTPVSAMLGVSELLQETQLSGSQQDYIRTLQRSSQELLQLLEEAGQSVRFNEGEVELSKQLINLPELIAETLSGFRNIAAERRLELICDVDHSVSEQLLGDPSRIKQLLSHAMNSAFEHSEAGHILLAVTTSESNVGQINIDISHRGKGFSPTERNALNRNGPSQDNRVNPRFAVMAQLVALMNGRISVHSSPSGVNCLSIVILLSAVNQRELPSPTAPKDLQNKRLLVVDNNQTFCDVITKQCQHWGMQVFSANTEHTALAVLRNQQLLEQPLDILLIDEKLPSGSGIALAQRLAGESGNVKPPLVLLLAHSNIKLDPELVKAAKIRKVLSKPLSNLALRSALITEMHYDTNLPKVAETAGRKGLHCLIAEDNATNAQVLTRMLASLGISVSLVENGQEAVNLFMRQSFDLVFMDIEMPIMDGVEATEQIRAFERDDRANRTPIFGLTANALDEQREIYLQAGMDLHLIKPIRLWELSEAIKRWTDFKPEKVLAEDK